MDTLTWLLQQIVDQRQRYRHAWEELDRERTVSLEDLVLRPDHARAVLRAPWLETERFNTRLRLVAEFFCVHRTDESLRRNVPLFFLQWSDPTEDVAEYERQCAENKDDTMLHEILNRLPWEARYHHLETNFTPHFDGEHSARHIRPLRSYSRPHGQLIGYRVPCYPKIWGISSRLATEYLTSIVIHDLGHYFLPSVGSDNESLHRAVMLHVAPNPTLDPQEVQTPFEALMSADIFDPFFFTNGRMLAEAACATKLTTVQRALANLLLDHLTDPPKINWLRRAWKLSRGLPLSQARAHCEDQLINVILPNLAGAYADRSSI